MTTEDRFYFEALKQAIARRFLESHSAPSALSEWKGDTIVAFQEDLRSKTKGAVSEKWFYTYFKNTPERLPRIDLLNLLSAYIDSKDWHHFKETHKAPVNSSGKTKTYGIIIGGIFIVSVLIMALIPRENTFHFCFVSEDTEDPITNMALDISILHDAQSPEHFKTDSTGCFSYTSPEDYLKFVVRSPFHTTDTIVRHIEYSHQNSTVRLQTDDYALILDYYTNGKVLDLKRRQQKLQQLIAKDAVIYQVFRNDLGIEMYSKADFIRQLTIPTRTLKRIKVVDKQYDEQGQIVKLKFIVE